MSNPSEIDHFSRPGSGAGTRDMGPPDFFLFHLPGPFASTLSPLVAGNESETVRRKVPRETGVEVPTESLKAWFLGSPLQRPLGVPSRVAPAVSEK